MTAADIFVAGFSFAVAIGWAFWGYVYLVRGRRP